MNGSGKVYCVTGASGYIASWLVKLLLHHGHTVHATVRDLNDPKKTQHLYALEGAKERLHLFKTDLLEDGSFDAAVHGCEGVFHTASPVILAVEDPQVWYLVSKIMAEEAAWKFAEENNLDMVVINPSVVFGPVLRPTLSLGCSAVLSMIKGAPTPAFLTRSFGIVDVRDTAETHILAMEVTSANGRYCLAESVLRSSELVKILKKLYPEYQCPEKCADEEPFEPTHQISKEKVQCLGLTYTPVELTLKDMIESFKEQELIN